MVRAEGPMWDATQVKFGFEQRWTAPVDDVVEVYLDETFWGSLADLSTTSPPEVLGIERKGDRAVVRLHWVLSVELPKEAARFIDPNDVAWVEETHWNLVDRTAQVSFQPDQAAGLLRASADAALLAQGDDAVRSIRGELKVRIPLLGHKVEPVIVEGVGDHLDEEAGAVAARLGV
jgi:hypothetical protein